MSRKPLALTMWMVVLLTIVVGCNGGSGDDNTTSVCQQTSGTAFIGLAQQGGSTSYIYNTEIVDPLVFCQTKHAVVSKVVNDSGYNISIAHGGAGSNFFILNSGTSIADFNGQLVEGNWSAQYGGNVNNAPGQITLKVEWVRP